MSSIVAVQPINNFETNSRRSRAVAETRTSRWRGSADVIPIGSGKAKQKETMDPTPERMAKDDAPITTSGGLRRSPAPIERLYRAGKLDLIPHINHAMLQTAEKLAEHYYGASLVGVRAQDLNRVVSGGGGPDANVTSENAVYHFEKFKLACKLMGWSDANPYRGAGRLVVAFVCEERALKDAATEFVPVGSSEARLGAAMDRLREGLYALAVHWKFC
jgi:hypothetical protein